VIFFGTAEFAVPSLERVAAQGHAVVMCVTQPDRPQGRGLIRGSSPVKRSALRLALPLAQPERPTPELFQTLHPEIGVVAAYGQLIREDVLALAPHGMLGVHPSLLPKYRGAAPVAWALLNGETTTGSTIFRLNDRLDAGEIVLQEAVTIQPHEDAHALTGRLAHVGAQALVDALALIASGRAHFEPQADSQATFAPKLTKSQGRIDWRASAERLERLVRATTPWPGATTEWRNRPLKVWGAAVGQAPAPQAPPGTVVRVTASALVVAAGQGTLDITDVQPAGRRRMRVSEFLAGHPIAAGERFGADDA